ncbi:Ig-like domain-containing protein [Alloalcanivorax mobilis]|uniref:Ig-like domain-containing protein n=1 Tax=Alloalcanivorax mobilis TaxID=2019569 RepID=UPI000C7911F4|nr:Ig-like domain-containing protein [Alloalcanivorax mobilis]
MSQSRFNRSSLSHFLGIRFIALILVSVLIASCGGSDSKDLIPGNGDTEIDPGNNNGGDTGDEDNGSDDNVANATMALTLADAEGVVVGTVDRPITGNRSARVRAMISADQSNLAGMVVTFKTTLGELDPVSGTALTNTDGVAEIALNAGEDAGAGTITATTTVDGEEVTSDINFQTSGNGADGDDNDDTAVSVLLGNGTGGDFQEGEIELSDTTVNAKSSLSALVNLVDAEGNIPWSGTATVTFSSTCASAGKASFDPAEIIPVGGTAITSYTPANDCADDVITASVTLAGETSTATSDTITVIQSTAASMTFQGAEPPVIGLLGSSQIGVPESSTLSFQVKDSNGDPVSAGQEIAFEVSSGNGGFSITSGEQSTTDSNGLVQVTVRSGTVPLSAFVIAKLVDNADIRATGSVSVQSGPITQNRFSLALETINPRAGSHQGVTVDVNVRAADRFGNWAPDGTRINFTTELGDIDGSCTTSEGQCSVVWTSQGVQTAHFDTDRATRECFTGDSSTAEQTGLVFGIPCLATDRYGRNTVSAWTEGEESFVDVNGNNIYDSNESWLALPEAFRDDNETGLHDSGVDYSEDFRDHNTNGEYDQAGTHFRGLGCSTEARNLNHCDDLANVRDSQVMVLSTDQIHAYFVDAIPNSIGWQGVSQWGSATPAGISPLSQLQVVPGFNRYWAVIADSNGNAPFSTFRATITLDSDFSLPGSSVICQAENTTEAIICPIIIQGSTDPEDFAEAEPGTLMIKYTDTAEGSYQRSQLIPLSK